MRKANSRSLEGCCDRPPQAVCHVPIPLEGNSVTGN